MPLCANNMKIEHFQAQFPFENMHQPGGVIQLPRQLFTVGVTRVESKLLQLIFHNTCSYATGHNA